MIISVGMPRAGSGWYYNLMHDLIVANGGSDARYIRKRFHLEGIWTEVNCNIGVLSPRRLLLSLLPALAGYTYVIKAHAAPSPLAILFLRRNWIRAAYVYRDPRDAMLSAYENGLRAREKGLSNAFAGLVDFEHSLKFMQEYVKISQAWLDLPVVLHTRYEDLLTEYDEQVGILCEFLQLDENTPAVQTVLNRYRPEQATAEQKGLHFRKGKIGRFRQVYSPSEQQSLNREFSAYLLKYGYPLDEPVG